MKVLFSAICSVILLLSVQVQGQGNGGGNGVGNGVGGGANSGTPGTPVEGYFNFHFYEWNKNSSGVITYHHLYPSTPISNGHINQLLSDLNEFIFTATEAHQTNEFGSNNVVDRNIMSIGTTDFSDCLFPDTTVDDFDDPSFWCPITFTFYYSSSMPGQEYNNLTAIKDILSAHSYNRDIFDISTYTEPLSNFLGGTLHPKGGFWYDIGDIGLCGALNCRYRSGAEDEKLEGAVPRSIEDLEREEEAINEEMMANATMHTATDGEEASMNSTTMNTTDESDGTEVEDIVGSSAPKMLASLFAISLMVCTSLL